MVVASHVNEAHVGYLNIDRRHVTCGEKTAREYPIDESVAIQIRFAAESSSGNLIGRYERLSSLPLNIPRALRHSLLG